MCLYACTYVCVCMIRVCVCVCLCISCLHASTSHASLSPQSSTARQCAAMRLPLSLPRVSLFSFFVFFFFFKWMPGPARARTLLPSPQGDRSAVSLHAVNVDLKVGRFLVSLIPEKSRRAIRTRFVTRYIRNTKRNEKSQRDGDFYEIIFLILAYINIY